MERREAEARTAREERGGEFVCVVGDDAEAGIGCVFLHDAAEGHLRGGRHGVGFVEDDQLKACCQCGGGIGRVVGGGGGSKGVEDLFGRGECLLASVLA